MSVLEIENAKLRSEANDTKKIIQDLTAKLQALSEESKQQDKVKAAPKNSKKDFYTELLGFIASKDVALFKKLEIAIANVEKRSGKNVKNHLNFGDCSDAALEYIKNDAGEYFGEVNAANKAHGRGFSMFEKEKKGSLVIQKYENGRT